MPVEGRGIEYEMANEGKDISCTEMKKMSSQNFRG